MRGALVAFRLDLARLDLLSSGNIVAMLIPAIFAATFSVAMDSPDSVGGGIIGGTFGICTVMSASLFATDRLEGHSRMGGMIPSKRGNQVIGRYLTLAVFAVIFLLETALAFAVSTLILSPGDLPSVLGRVASSAVGAVSAYLIGQAMLFPVMYRFADSRKVIGFILAVFFVAFIGVLGMVRYIPEPAVESIFTGIGDVLTGPMSIIISIAAVALSLVVSMHINRSKEW